MRWHLKRTLLGTFTHFNSLIGTERDLLPSELPTLQEILISVKEFAFTKGQRDKIGSIGPHQIGLPDIPEKKKLLKRQKREEERKWLDEHKQRSAPDSSLLLNELIFAGRRDKNTILYV